MGIGERPLRTILLVEDDLAFAYSAARHLKSAGYDVVTVPNSMKALDVLDSERQVDLVLSDIVLASGQPNGISLVRMARMKRPGIKTMLMTGYRDLLGNDAASPGKLLYKPVDLETLSREVRALVAA
jgi:two-component system, NtrC family, sensor kinase